jgi:hypothetical protein
MHRSCQHCGTLLEQPERACPSCGKAQGITVTPKPARMEFRGYAPTIVIHGREQSSGDTVTRVEAPGASSRSRINARGDISISLTGVEGVGRPGEARVAKVLCAHLKAQGNDAEIRPGQDNRGEDRILEAGTSFTLQVVTVPDKSDFWQSASTSSASTSVPLAQATQWLEDSIQKKVKRTPEKNRPEMILALDANHSASLAELGVVNAYLKEFGDPVTRFRLAEVWVVGPTAQQCIRVGSGSIS